MLELGIKEEVDGYMAKLDGAFSGVWEEIAGFRQ